MNEKKFAFYMESLRNDGKEGCENRKKYYLSSVFGMEDQILVKLHHHLNLLMCHLHKLKG